MSYVALNRVLRKLNIDSYLDFWSRKKSKKICACLVISRFAFRCISCFPGSGLLKILFTWSVARTVWSPVTDHYVNKVKKISFNSKCYDCFYVADKGNHLL